MEEKTSCDTSSRRSETVSTPSLSDNRRTGISLSCSDSSSHWHLASAYADLPRQKTSYDERIAARREDLFGSFTISTERGIGESSKSREEEKDEITLCLLIDVLEKVRAETKEAVKPNRHISLFF